MKNVKFKQITDLFGIVDTNPRIKVPSDANVFSTNIFIPMEGKIDHKTYFYLSGMVKLVETFRSRINNSNLSGQGWMLFIYYDSMFDADSSYNNSKYIPNNNLNNTENKIIKENYSKNKDQLKQLLQLYKQYLHIIRENVDGKYDFIKLYSFNCSSIARKGKRYLGHPSTFGSIVRLIPMFDPQIKRIFCVNISHAISPRLCYLINEWVKSEKLLLTSGLIYYKYDYQSPHLITVLQILVNNKQLKYSDLFTPRIAAGLFGFYKNDNSLTLLKDRYDNFINSMNKLIELNNSIPNVFAYSIDEILLGYLFKEIQETQKTQDINVLFYKSDNIKPFDKSFLHLFQFYENKSMKILTNQYLKKLLKIHLQLDPKLINGMSIGSNTNDTIQLHIKYDSKLNPRELDKVKQNIDEYIEYVLSEIRNKDGKIIINKKVDPTLTDEENKNLINFIKLYLTKMYCDDDDRGECITMYKDEKFMKQLKELDLYQGELLYIISSHITQLGILSRYTSRTFMRSIGQDESIKKTLGESSNDITGLNILLDSYDEEKPLIINSKNDTDYYYDFVKHFPEYFTFMNPEDPKLLYELMKYYNNPLKVLTKPYEMIQIQIPIPQVGGKRRTLKKSKK